MKYGSFACLLPLLVAGCCAQTHPADARHGAATTQPAVAHLPPYKQSPQQLDAFLKAHAIDPGSIGDRAVAIARRNIGQPYDMYLLGEAPFERIDDQPVFCLAKSDCVVATEHELAMATSSDLPSFLRMLQRIRYKDGQIGVRTRNHYTEADWDVNNGWLVEDVSRTVGGDLTKQYPLTINRKAFFKERYKLDVQTPVQKLSVDYVPDDALAGVKGRLKNGDVFNSIKGTPKGGAWASHVGIVSVLPNGEVHLLHSNETDMSLQEETIEHFVARTTEREGRQATTRPTIARHMGFKFLRPREDALVRLKKIDGDAAPRVTVPADSPISFDAYVAQVMAGTNPAAVATGTDLPADASARANISK